MTSASSHTSASADDTDDGQSLRYQDNSLLRFITCGSVDDGKSTLIGRLLFEHNQIFDDQLAALKIDSERFGTQGKEIDFALLVDGLASEREQGITIDVAYRFFSTDHRRYIVADAPGHEQYTRNMVTGASTAELAVILIDARKGVLPQTRRHSFIVQLLGIRHVVLAVNKMDLVDYEERVFNDIVDSYRQFANEVGIRQFRAIPISGFKGDNITKVSLKTPWYRGPSLLEHLDSVELDTTADQRKPLRMPVQRVNHPASDFRGVSGLISAGQVRLGDEVRCVQSGRITRVSRISAYGGDLEYAVAGQSITLCFSDEIDCSRGEVVAANDDAPQTADQFEASLVWLTEVALVPGREYWLKLATQTVSATVIAPKYRINVNSLLREPAKTLDVNAIGVAVVSTQRPIVFEPYETSRALGGFILIDKATNTTAAAGMLHFSLRRSQNVHRQAIDVSREHRAKLKNQKAAVLWLTGLSGAGKSTIANLVEKKLTRMNRHTILLDGDNVRLGLNKDLGFTEADRVENIRRVGEVAKLLADAGLIVITALISPFRAERDMVRKLMVPGEFFEIFIDTPLSVAEVRDVKGLYKKARAGTLQNFTGIDSPYEVPESAEIHVDTLKLTADEAADLIVETALA